MTFWLIAGGVAVVLVALWHWADSRSTIRGSVRQKGIDIALKNGESASTMIRHQAGGPTAGAGR